MLFLFTFSLHYPFHFDYYSYCPSQNTNLSYWKLSWRVAHPTIRPSIKLTHRFHHLHRRILSTTIRDVCLDLVLIYQLRYPTLEGSTHSSIHILRYTQTQSNTFRFVARIGWICLLCSDIFDVLLASLHLWFRLHAYHEGYWVSINQVSVLEWADKQKVGTPQEGRDRRHHPWWL